MTITQTLTFLTILFSQFSTSQSATYDYAGHFSSDAYIDTNIVNLGNNSSCYFVSYFNVECDVNYDDSVSYLAYNFDFNYHLDCYTLSSSNVSTLVESYDYVVSAPWEITPSSYSQEFERCYVWIYNRNSTLIFDFQYDSATVDSTTFDISSTGINTGVRFDITFDGSSYINLLENSISSRYEEGFDDGYTLGHQEGYDEGYSDGISGAMDVNSESFIIFNGILNVAMIPINVFLAIFNFEIFGINVTSLVTALLSVAVLIIVIRLLTGKKSE